MVRSGAVLLLATALLLGCSPGVASTGAPGTPGAGASASPGGPGSSAAPGGSAGAPDLAHVAIALEPFVNVAGGPLAIAAPPDGSGRLFVASQDGRAWVVENGQVLPDPLLDLRERLVSGGEQGLLGIAVHPEFPDDPRIFVDYTDLNGDTVVASLTIDPANPNRVDPASHRQILFVDQPYANHNGGAVLFGPDGYLYVSLGDGGSGGDPQGNGQNTEALLGKILRLDVDTASGGEAYGIPADNPFAKGGGRGEVWQYGLRNPWRLSFDRERGDLWIGDVGQSSWEEVDVAPAGVGGLNFGWNVMEGSHCYRAERCQTEGLMDPVSDYGRDLGCTVIGGYVYRGAAYPALRGAYVFADYCTGTIFAIDAASSGLVAPITMGNADGPISAFGEDAAGELYVTALDGRVFRVVAAAR